MTSPARAGSRKLAAKPMTVARNAMLKRVRPSGASRYCQRNARSDVGGNGRPRARGRSGTGVGAPRFGPHAAQIGVAKGKSQQSQREQQDEDGANAAPHVSRTVGSRIRSENDVASDSVDAPATLLHQTRQVYGKTRVTAHPRVRGGGHAGLPADRPAGGGGRAPLLVVARCSTTCAGRCAAIGRNAEIDDERQLPAVSAATTEVRVAFRPATPSR